MFEKKAAKKAAPKKTEKKPAKKYLVYGLTGDDEVVLPHESSPGFKSKAEAEAWLAVRYYPYDCEIREA
tara:strand:- start:5011 stop:5217 length:207 start_codon:yes stop_codon:yes gene_type:complete